MKKLSIFACLSFFALASFTSKPELQGNPSKTEIATASEEIGTPITIVSVAPDGMTGIAITGSGIVVSFVNPLYLPITTGSIVSATVTLDCSIIDPPRRPRKMVTSTTESEPTTAEETQTTYGVAIIVSL